MIHIYVYVNYVHKNKLINIYQYKYISKYILLYNYINIL